MTIIRSIYRIFLIFVVIMDKSRSKEDDDEEVEMEGRKDWLSSFPLYRKFVGPANTETTYAVGNNFKNTAKVAEEEFFLMKKMLLNEIRNPHHVTPISNIFSRDLRIICEKFMSHDLFTFSNVKLSKRSGMNKYSSKKKVVPKYFDTRPYEHRMYKCPCYVDPEGTPADTKPFPRFGNRICKANEVYIANGLKSNFTSAFVFTRDKKENRDMVRVVAHIVLYPIKKRYHPLQSKYYVKF